MKPLLSTHEFVIYGLIAFAAIALITAMVEAWRDWKSWYKQVRMNVDRPPSELATRGSIQDFRNREKH